MIRHTVVFTLVHEPGSAAERDFIETGRTTLTSIPGVENFSVLRQVSAKSDYRFLFEMDFADQAVYDAYNVHPSHVGFVESRWVPEVAEFQELDFTSLD